MFPFSLPLIKTENTIQRYLWCSSDNIWLLRLKASPLGCSEGNEFPGYLTVKITTGLDSSGEIKVHLTLKKPNQTRKPCTKKQLCSGALEMNCSPCLLACFKQSRDFLRLPRALPTPAWDIHNGWRGADNVTFGEQKKAALKLLLKILSIIPDSVLTMQMASGYGKRINCDEYPTATTFLAWFSARGSQWQLCYRFQWVQVSHHPCLPWGTAKVAVSLPDT